MISNNSNSELLFVEQKERVLLIVIMGLNFDLGYFLIWMISGVLFEWLSTMITNFHYTFEIRVDIVTIWTEYWCLKSFIWIWIYLMNSMSVFVTELPQSPTSSSYMLTILSNSYMSEKFYWWHLFRCISWSFEYQSYIVDCENIE